MISKEVKIELSDHLNLIINNTYPEGFVGIEPIDMSTHHLIISFNQFNHPLLFGPLYRAINWFLNIDDPRDQDPKDFNPFKLIALSEMKHPELNNYVSEKIKVLKTVHKKASGHVVLQLFQGHSLAGVDQDVFPTTIGAHILVKDKSQDSLKVAEDSLKWVADQIVNEAVQKNIFSNLGFFVLVALEYQKHSGNDLFGNIIDHCIEKIYTSQDSNGIWGNEIVQSAYLFYDLNCIKSFIEDSRIEKMLNKFQQNLLENYSLDTLINKELSLQSIYLAVSAVLRGFSKILSLEEKDEILTYVVNRMFIESPAIFRNYHDYMLRSQEIDKHIKRIEEKGVLEIDPEIFNARKFSVKKDQIFVLMPFGKKEWKFKKNETWQDSDFEFDSFYERLVKPTIEELGLKAKRADSIFAPKPFMEKIWKDLNESELIIADLTSSNGNVFYELGIAHTLGKRVISITQDERYVPSDLKNVEYVQYPKHVHESEDFKLKLRKAIADTLGINLDKR
jgi:hypothetical protein